MNNTRISSVIYYVLMFTLMLPFYGLAADSSSAKKAMPMPAANPFPAKNTPMGPQMPFGPGGKDMPMPSEEEMKQFEAQLKKEIDEAVNAMSPEQQKVFYDTMEKMDRMSQTPEGREKLEKLVTGEMDEAELNAFLESIIPEELKESLEPQPATEPAKSTEEKKVTPAPQPSSKEEKLRGKIQHIITKINSFLLKAGTYSELSGKVQNWKKKKSIDLPAQETWSSFRNETHTLVQKLSKIIEPGIKAGTYKYLDQLIKQESLIDKLTQLEQVLEKFEPQIEERSIEVTQMNDASQKGLQKIINGLSKALYEVKIGQELDLIFSTFEPIAKKSQEEEQAAQEKALQESKKPRAPGKITSAGKTPEVEGGVFYPSYAPSSFGDRGFTPGSSPFDTGSKEPFGSPKEPTKPQKSAGGAKGKPEKSDKEKGSKEEKKESDKKEKDGAKKPESAKAPQGLQELAMKDPSIIFYQEQIADKIETLHRLLTKNPTLAGIHAHLTDENPVDIDLANNIIPQAIRLMNDPLTGIIADLDQLKSRAKKKKLTPQIVSKLQAELKKAYQKNAKNIQPLFAQIESIKKDWDTIKDKVSKEKQYAYLRIDGLAQAPEFDPSALEALQKRVEGGELNEEQAKEEFTKLLGQQMSGSKDPLATIKAQVVPQPFPASLYDLQAALEELHKKIDSLNK